jgi:hypothetical protein
VNLNDISTQLLFTTVPIWVEKPGGTTVSATGFIYNVPVVDKPGQFIPLLLTNHHVVDGAIRGLLELVERVGDQPAPSKRVRAQLDAGQLTARVDAALDLAAVPLGPLLNQLEQSGRPVFFRSIGPDLMPSQSAIDDLAAMEEIVFIGYPSGLRDVRNATPLVRRGITATPVWNDFEGDPAFLIDAGVFPGSSGSPVFILNQGAYATKEGLTVGNRLLFLGVLSHSIIRPEPNSNVFLGLGKVVKSGAVRSFVDAQLEGLS